MRTTSLVTMAAALATVCTARAEVTDTRTLEESVSVDATESLVVIVDNIVGSIRVTGHDLDRVAMTAVETVSGDLRADIDRARAEIGLRTESEPGRVAFRVRRTGDDSDCDCRNHRWDGYRVAYDIELRVPRAATIDVATVSDGDITVEGVHGDFTVANVNGAVRLAGLRGAGRVNTVNGDVDASFEHVPADATSFKTVNGDLDVAFPGDLSAELRFETMNGEVFTDFEVEPVGQPAAAGRTRERGLFLMNANRNSAFRVRSGGQMHSFRTLNGDIYVRKVDQ